jgi:hypothetical protein
VANEANPKEQKEMEGKQQSGASKPIVQLKRAKSFQEFGHYEVLIDGQAKHLVYRSPDDGWWYEDIPGKHFSECVVGFNKKDVLAHYAK